ncbi:hypothetical protein DJ68_05125 [Halorubrum sp. C3]|nr:hypothetical protein DJ68_05125 [Halorubrum sp. C3]
MTQKRLIVPTIILLNDKLNGFPFVDIRIAVDDDDNLRFPLIVCDFQVSGVAETRYFPLIFGPDCRL